MRFEDGVSDPARGQGSSAHHIHDYRSVLLTVGFTEVVSSHAPRSMRTDKITKAQRFEEILQRFEIPLLQYATRITGDRERARDVVQETFIKFQSNGALDHKDKPETWLFTVCRNRALNVCRKERRLMYLEEETIESQEDRQPMPYQHIEEEEATGFLMRIIATLPPRQQEVLRLKFQNELSYEQIAEITKTTANSVVFLFTQPSRLCVIATGRTRRILFRSTRGPHDMNIDDPKLTAFALDELDEPERSAVARAVAESVAAQQLVGEIRKLSDVIKNEFAAETQTNVVTALGSPEEPRTATGLQPQSLSDIRDDPWFWSIGRPLAIAAILAIFGIIAGVTFWPRQNSTRFAGPINLPLAKPADVQGEFQMLSEVEPSLPAKVPAAGHSPPAHPAMVAKQSAYKFRGEHGRWGRRIWWDTSAGRAVQYCHVRSHPREPVSRHKR